MLVVADTTPINYLVLIAQIDILASLYEQVVIPSAVATELRTRKPPMLSGPGLPFHPCGV